MKILLTSNLNEGNDVIDGLYHRLRQHVDIQISVKQFWSTKILIMPDIIHIQWPEQLFNWSPIDKKDIDNLIKQLKFWKSQGSKIIVTRHNILPHTLNELYKKAYNIIYSYCDAVIHYSDASINNFHTMYDSKKIHPMHEIIFHPMYSDIKNNSNTMSARKYLGIDMDQKVILIFGAMRNDEERQFTLNVFNELNIENKLLLVPSWYQRVGKRTPAKWLFSKVRIFFDRPDKKLKLSQKFVHEDEIQMYMNAADVVFLPRFEVLNSGVLLLAYSFNKIVVGPSSGSVGELLELSHNPAFEVGNISDAALKIEKGLKQSSENINNYEFVKKNMNWDIIIEKHLQLYQRVATNAALKQVKHQIIIKDHK